MAKKSDKGSHTSKKPSRTTTVRNNCFPDTSDAANVSENSLQKSCLFISKKVQKIRQAKIAFFNKKFCSQNKDFVGFIPLSPLPEPIQDRSTPTVLNHLQMHKKFKDDGRPNYCGLQLPVPSKLNAEKFFHYLKDYWDWQVPFFIKFGFPLGISDKKILLSEPGNHPSAEKFPNHVDFYLKEELNHNAILGPFK